jgi:hypothetical protein
MGGADKLIAVAVNETASQQQQQQQLQPPAQQQSPNIAQQQYRSQFPARTTSNRHSVGLALEQQGASPSQQTAGYDSTRRGSHQPQPTPSYVQEPKKGLRHRLGLSSHKEEDPAKQAIKAEKIARRASVRRSDPRAQEYQHQQAQENGRLQAAQLYQRQGSSPHLPPSSEQDEDNLDPFLQKEDNTSPQVPPKDAQYQGHQPQFSPSSSLQGEYSRPPLAKRVSTEGSYQGQGGVDRYSPEHQTTPTSQHQYQSYHPAVPNPQNTDYQAWAPQNPQNPAAPSPLIGNAQLHQQDHTAQQQNYYYQQAQAQAQQHSSQAPQESQQQSQVHYPPPPAFSSQVQPHQGQDFSHVQHARGPSQAQGDPNAPPASHQIPQIVQGGQQADAQQQQQQLRPPSSQAQLAPPSPLQPAQPYQPYDAPQGQPSQAAEPHSQNTTPPQQGQNNMPPANQQRNTLRKVNETGQPPSGAPTRESSLLQQPQAQGQAQGQPPVSPGIPTFGTNVVPTASQGQPYRGEKQGQQPQGGGELGRATPPPRAANDMSDDEIALLIKEHDVLRTYILFPLRCLYLLNSRRREVSKGQALLLRTADPSTPTAEQSGQPAALPLAHILGR